MAVHINTSLKHAFVTAQSLTSTPKLIFKKLKIRANV